METRRLGADGPLVSVICFGAWPIGGGMGLVSEQQALATVQAAVDAGMTFVDTAESYRASEALIGKAVSGRRDEVFLATKLSGNDHSIEHITRALENSLRALNTEYIDLYQLHSPQLEWPIEETMGHLLDLQRAGKIRYIGVSNFSADETKEASRHARIQCSQPRYNMLFRDAEESILPFCMENGVGVIPHSVLAKGMLSGRYPPGHQFTVYDERNAFDFFRGETHERLWSTVQRLSEWAQDHGSDLVQLAIAWSLAQPGVASAIVGAKTAEQVEHNARAADWRLSQSDLDEIRSILDADAHADGASNGASPAATDDEPEAQADEPEAQAEEPEESLDLTLGGAAEDSEIYTQLLLGLHQDLEEQEKRLADHLRELDTLKGQLNALKSLWITTLAAITIGTVALVVAILS